MPQPGVVPVQDLSILHQGAERDEAFVAADCVARCAKKNPQHRAELLQGGSFVKVPCLQIRDERGNVQWLYESTAINEYLHQRFGSL